MNNVMTIAGNELRRIFVSPLAWSVLGVVQLILGFVFLMLLIDYANNPQIAMDQYTGVADFIGAGLYGFAVIVLLLVMPLMTMRLFAEERRSGSIDLLHSAPVSLTEVVLGKYLGLMGFMLALVVLLGLMPFSLLFGTDLDVGRIFAGLLGLFLLGLLTRRATGRSAAVATAVRGQSALTAIFLLRSSSCMPSTHMLMPNFAIV